MNATTAKLTICNRTVAISDSELDALNAVLAKCPIYERYGDGKIQPGARLQIEATLTLECKETDVNLS